jgi:hypothetical protein
VSDPDDRRQIETRLRSYAAAHPGAADTVPGILAFWLVLPFTQANSAETERVLRALRAEGVVTSRPLPRGELWIVRPAIGRDGAS